MKRMLNVRNSIITALCITIILMGIGFAFLSIKLEQKNADKPVFDVSFINVSNISTVKGGALEPIFNSSITNRGKELNMQLTLNAPRDEMVYKAIIRNVGTIPAEIIDLKETPDYQNDITAISKIAPVTITHNDIIGHTLEPNEEIELKITVTYNQSTTIERKQISYNLALITGTKVN